MRVQEEIIINGKSLKKHLELHKKWLNDANEGERLALRDADLRYADLRRANLRDADLRRANLRDADLRRANLRDADLRDADIDFSCLPLWCGGLDFKIDEKQAKQLVYHVLNLMQYSKLDTKKIFKKVTYKWLEDSHLVTEHKLPVLEEASNE
jgi:hypothetical protein